jgi:tRNA threonylcarbamoyladenosine biosynthesis protein TsaE
VSGEALTLTSGSPEETERLGRLLAGLLRGGELLCLVGELGAGKTVFVRGLAAGLGCPPNEVASPTYVLERVYAGREMELHHLDAYRLSGPEEFEASDLGAALGLPGTVSAIEWADRVESALPAERLTLRFDPAGDDRRRIGVRASGAGHDELLTRLRSALDAGH